MKTYLFALIIANLSILCASCTKELRYSKEALLKRAQAADPSVTLILPRNMDEGVQCPEYGRGCLSGHIVKVRNLEMIAVEFTTMAEAKSAAKRFRGFYTRNWLLDDVTGEPALEDFVQTHLDAKRP